MFDESTSFINVSAWEPSSITSCSNMWYENLGCHPLRFLELGCYTDCCATSIAHSNHFADFSITGELGDAVEVVCDTGYTFLHQNVVSSSALVCNNITGIFPSYECIANTNECLDNSSCPSGSPLCLDITGSYLCLPTLMNISENVVSLNLLEDTAVHVLISFEASTVLAIETQNNSLLIDDLYYLANPILYSNDFDIYFELSNVFYSLTNRSNEVWMQIDTSYGHSLPLRT